jgi:hypothetical protein
VAGLKVPLGLKACPTFLDSCFRFPGLKSCTAYGEIRKRVMTNSSGGAQPSIRGHTSKVGQPRVAGRVDQRIGF